MRVKLPEFGTPVPSGISNNQPLFTTDGHQEGSHAITGIRQCKKTLKGIPKNPLTLQ